MLCDVVPTELNRKATIVPTLSRPASTPVKHLFGKSRGLFRNCPLRPGSKNGDGSLSYRFAGPVLLSAGGRPIRGPVWQCFVCPGLQPHDHVPVVGHNAVGQYRQRVPRIRLFQNPFQGRVVVPLAEYLHPRIRTVENIVNQTAPDRTSASRHVRSVSNPKAPADERLPTPSCTPRLRQRISGSGSSLLTPSSIGILSG